MTLTITPGDVAEVLLASGDFIEVDPGSFQVDTVELIPASASASEPFDQYGFSFTRGGARWTGRISALLAVRTA